MKEEYNLASILTTFELSNILEAARAVLKIEPPLGNSACLNLGKVL
jgi:hypothetical protein